MKFKITLFTDKPTNQCSNETVRQQRRRGINLNEDCGLDLVFLFDASVSVNKFYFQTSLEFAKELLKIIGASKRYQRFTLTLSELSEHFETVFYGTCLLDFQNKRVQVKLHQTLIKRNLWA